MSNRWVMMGKQLTWLDNTFFFLKAGYLEDSTFWSGKHVPLLECKWGSDFLVDVEKTVLIGSVTKIQEQRVKRNEASLTWFIGERFNFCNT